MEVKCRPQSEGVGEVPREVCQGSQGLVVTYVPDRDLLGVSFPFTETDCVGLSMEAESR